MGSVTNEHRIANLEARMAVSEQLGARFERETKESLNTLKGQMSELIETIATGKGGISVIWKVGAVLASLGAAFFGGSRLGH